jgi:hypothetical protein
MNTKLKELAAQAGFHITLYPADTGWVWCSDAYPIDEELERFAELVRQDERQGCAEDYLKIMRDAVAREREACAKICEEKALYFQYDFIPPYDVADSCAEEIRARGKE